MAAVTHHPRPRQLARRWLRGGQLISVAAPSATMCRTSDSGVNAITITLTVANSVALEIERVRSITADVGVISKMTATTLT